MTLATELRPSSLDTYIGQDHLTKPGGVIYKMIQANRFFSFILYGPPGSGKTSLAYVISQTTHTPLHTFNASTDKKADLEHIIKHASLDQPIILLIDEIHRLTKPIQDYLLSFLESGEVILIGATTENPYITINPAIRSRCQIFQVHPLSPLEIEQGIQNAINYLRESEGLNVELTPEALNHLSYASNGDLRAAYTYLDLLAHAEDSDSVTITEEDLTPLTGLKDIAGDKDGDAHYNLLSAFQKSIRGSDADASLYYLARLIKTGDLQSIVRRLQVIAFEDVGLANRQSILLTLGAIESAEQVGFPEAKIPLAVATVDLALSPKSNAAYKGINNALEALGANQPIPDHLKDTHYQGAKKLGAGIGYLYPHDYPYHWVKQQYLPDALKEVRFLDFDSGTPYENQLKDRYNALQ